MKQTTLLKFEDLYNQHCLTLIHDCLHNRAPDQVTKLIIEGPNERFALRNQIDKLGKTLNVQILFAEMFTFIKNNTQL